MAGPPPLTPPPQGDESRAGELLAVSVIFSLLSTIVVILRLYTRIRIVQNIGWDDYTIVMGQVLSLGCITGEFVMCASGTGHHMYYVPIDHVVRAGMWFYVAEILYFIATALVKISACLFLLRIMNRVTGKVLRRSLYTLMIWMVIVGFAAAIVIIVQCVPVAGAWDPRIKIRAKCFGNATLFGIGYAQGAWSVVTDLACATFPVIVIRRLQMKRSIKIGLWIIMGMGVFTAIACIVRIIHLPDLTKGDFTWNAITIIEWSIIERNVGVIATSIPALQPLFKHIVDHMSTDSTKKGGARPTPPLNTWKDSTTNAFNSRNRNFQPIQNDPSIGSVERIFPLNSKDIRMTTDVDLSFAEAGEQLPAKDTVFEMKSKDERFL